MKKLFEELISSIKEAGRIHRGEQKPSREFTAEPQDGPAIRKKVTVEKALAATTRRNA